MTWRSISDEEMRACLRMLLWIRTARKWGNAAIYGPTWLPTLIHIRKSALFERLMSGKKPLEYPPPLGYACPWYAVVEDPGPHVAGFANRYMRAADICFHGERRESPSTGFDLWGERITAHADPNNIDDPGGLPLSPRDGSERSVHFIGGMWPIVERRSATEYIIRDSYHETPYRFRFWYDPDYLNPVRPIEGSGAWLLRNTALEQQLPDVPLNGPLE
jgi:hypothetical protein